MTQQGSGFGKVVLYVVLGILGVVVGITVIQWIFGNLLWLILLGGAVGVGYLLYKAGQKSVGGGSNRKKLPY